MHGAFFSASGRGFSTSNLGKELKGLIDMLYQPVYKLVRSFHALTVH